MRDPESSTADLPCCWKIPAVRKATPLRTVAAHCKMLRMRIATVTANRHAFDGQADGTPFRLLLAFDDGQTLRLGVAGDGYRMMMDSLPLDEPTALGEYGSIALEEVTQSLFAQLKNAEVKEVRPLRVEHQRVGIRLLLGSGDAFHFWTDGDELLWGDEDAWAAHDWVNGSIPVVGEAVEI
jgi:hypothetical protein